MTLEYIIFVITICFAALFILIGTEIYERRKMKRINRYFDRYIRVMKTGRAPGGKTFTLDDMFTDHKSKGYYNKYFRTRNRSVIL